MASCCGVITSLLFLLCLNGCREVCSTVSSFTFSGASLLTLDDLVDVPHEFLDITLPSLVAQGYSRRLMEQQTGRHLLNAGLPKEGKGKVEAQQRSTAPHTHPGGKGNPKPAPSKPGAGGKGNPKPAPSKPGAGGKGNSKPVPSKPGAGGKGLKPKGPPGTPKTTPGKALVITIGYKSTSTIRIPSNATNTLPWFDTALMYLRKAKGGELHIDAGLYPIEGQFVIKSSNTLVQGAGMKETILKLADYTPGPWIGAGFLRWTNEQNITVADLTLDGNKDKQHKEASMQYGRYAIYMHGYKNALFLRIATINFQRYGFDPHGQKSRGAFIWSHGLTVIGCVSSFNNWDGFTFDMTNNIYCKGNYAEGNGRHGFNIITGSKGVIVINNTAVNNGGMPPEISHGGLGCGFMTDNYDEDKYTTFPGGTRDVLYKNNVVRTADVGGFCAKGVSNVTMIGNTITDAGSCMYFMDNTVQSTFKDNMCKQTPIRIRYRNTEPASNIVANITCEGCKDEKLVTNPMPVIKPYEGTPAGGKTLPGK